MYQEKKHGDEIPESPPKGKGASLTIRYQLPRQPCLVKTKTVHGITLHEEIQDILLDNNNAWMTTHEISNLVNQRGRYKKKNGSSVTDFQIHGRTRNYPDLFERNGNQVRCV